MSRATPWKSTSAQYFAERERRQREPISDRLRREADVGHSSTAQMRAVLQAEVAEYLAAGGAIEQVAAGATAYGCPPRLTKTTPGKSGGRAR